jgi:hypothetical protein
MTSTSVAELYNACSDGDTAAVRRLLPAGGTQLDLSGRELARDCCIVPRRERETLPRVGWHQAFALPPV